mgnify:CR=1 FL=1
MRYTYEFYTKEWYALIQRQGYTSGLKKIPDKAYTAEEINHDNISKIQKPEY